MSLPSQSSLDPHTERLERIEEAAEEVIADLCALAEEQPGNPHDDLSARLYEIARKIEIAKERR